MEQNESLDYYKSREYKQDLAELNAHKEFEQVTKNVNPNVQNVMLPKPPKPGEVMYCQVCKQPMLPKDFSKNPTIRRREFKWHIHDKCFSSMDSLADRLTPGLMMERKKR